MKSQNKKDSAWKKYFDHNGGRVAAVKTAEEWTFDLSELFLGVRFAHGAHSRLYRGIYRDEPVAVKIVMTPADDEIKDLASKLEKEYTREVMLLSRLHHPNVIKIVAACRKPPVYCILTEYLSEGSLRSYMHKQERRAVPLQKLIAFALDIARGMEYIHSQGLIHRNLKREIVLISKNSHLQVADVGIACEQMNCDQMAGTHRWMAPSSFGLILWEMVAGTIPYEDMSPIQAAYVVVNKNKRPAIPLDCPPAVGALMEQCWSVKADKRPEFWKVVKVLEQLEASLARDGTLNLVQSPCCQDHKKGLLYWIQKLGPASHPNATMCDVPKPKFT